LWGNGSGKIGQKPLQGVRKGRAHGSSEEKVSKAKRLRTKGQVQTNFSSKRILKEVFNRGKKK